MGCAWPRCRVRDLGHSGVNYLGKEVCDRHWPRLAELSSDEMRKKLGIDPSKGRIEAAFARLLWGKDGMARLGAQEKRGREGTLAEQGPSRGTSPLAATVTAVRGCALMNEPAQEIGGRPRNTQSGGEGVGVRTAGPSSAAEVEVKV